MGTTMLWADGVLRDRTAALHARARHQAMRAPRRTSEEGEPRARTRLGVLRFTPVMIAAVTLALGVFGGTAYAYFFATVSGTGQVSVGKLIPVTVEQATVVPNALFPGGKAGLSLKLKNPNNRTLTLVGVKEVGTTVTVTSTHSGCSGTTVSVPTTVASGLSGYTLKASTVTTGVTTLVIRTGAQMSTSSPSACQGASFHITVTVSVRT